MDPVRYCRCPLCGTLKKEDTFYDAVNEDHPFEVVEHTLSSGGRAQISHDWKGLGIPYAKDEYFENWGTVMRNLWRCVRFLNANKWKD